MYFRGSLNLDGRKIIALFAPISTEIALQSDLIGYGSKYSLGCSTEQDPRVPIFWMLIRSAFCTMYMYKLNV
jgi:hypothetical protein